MTRREIILLGIIVIVVLIWVSAFFWQSAPTPIVQAQRPPPPRQANTNVPAPQYTPPPPIADPGGPLSIKTMPREQAVQLYVQRFNTDHRYDWKVPLDFYGKVVDENDQPVGGAQVNFNWTTIWMPLAGGSSRAKTQSDGAGLFSLTRKHGKVLQVMVQKEGYYSVDRGGSAVPFEFANPSEPWFYEADPSHPVIFHLQRKGNGTPLITKTVELPNHGHIVQAQIDLMKGSMGPKGTLAVSYDASKFLPGAEPFPWTFNLKMSEGGLVEANDQFMFMAPATGYAPTVTIEANDLNRDVWEDGLRKSYYFYLPSTNTYGHITIEASASLSMEVNYVYNPIPGQRYLEPASK